MIDVVMHVIGWAEQNLKNKMYGYDTRSQYHRIKKLLEKMIFYQIYFSALHKNKAKKKKAHLP